MSNRLKDQNVYPAGKRGERDLYRLSDVFRALLAWNAANNPESLHPRDRKTYYQAQREKLRLDQEQGLLVSREHLRAELAVMARLMTDFLDTLPDRLEREENMGPQALEHLEQTLDAMRTELADHIEAYDADTDAGTEVRAA